MTARYSSRLPIRIRRTVEHLVRSYPDRDVTWDRAGRAYLVEEARAACCATIRTPSRAWPHSEARHGLTRSHRRQWALEQIEHSIVQLASALAAAAPEWER